MQPTSEGTVWTCYTCNYEGLAEYETEEERAGEVAHCPDCGTVDGDGFGMKEHDPRFQDDLDPPTKETRCLHNC